MSDQKINPLAASGMPVSNAPSPAETPQITRVQVIPVAGQDSMLR